MKRKLTNLEEYYNELQEESPNQFRYKFNELSPETLDAIECSEGFRRFLIRGAWTKAFKFIICFIIPPAAIAYGIYLKHFA